MMVIDNKFDLGQSVYLKTDEEQLIRLVTGIQITTEGIIYRLINSTTETWHYDFEITKEKNYANI